MRKLNIITKAKDNKDFVMVTNLNKLLKSKYNMVMVDSKLKHGAAFLNNTKVRVAVSRSTISIGHKMYANRRVTRNWEFIELRHLR